MQVEVAAFVLSGEGRSALAELLDQPAALAPNRQLATLTHLRRRFSPEQAAGLLEVATARLKATQQEKFSRASALFFTRTGLEQSSGETIAAHRAARFAKSLPPGSRIADLGCGIGGDSLALAEYFAVTGVDLDPARLLFAEANLAAYGRAANFSPLETDINRFDPASYQGLFFDPARRTGEGRRIFSVEDYAPPLSIIKSWFPFVPEIAVKIAPGVKYDELADYDCEVEIISERGDVKEAVLWFGRLRSHDAAGHPVSRRATLLPGGFTLTNIEDKPPVPVEPPGRYLFEPDGAVIRAGLVEELALQIGAVKLDEDIAFLTSARLVATPFARPFEVLESLPFNLKKLNQRLNELGVGRVVVKKRGSPLDPQELERALKLKGPPGPEKIIVLTQVRGTHTALICEVAPP
jgi:SAM-dependent methyltransferase